MRPAALAVLGGVATAAVALVLAGLAGGPYLTADRVNGWIVAYAAALLVALVAAPFVLERALRARRAHRSLETGSDPEVKDERWEGAALAWGGIALLLLLVAVPVGIELGFAGDSLAGTAALVATVEAGLVVAMLVAWLLSQ